MMPFGDPFDLYYERVYLPAIEAANLAPARADDLFRPSGIVGDLWEMIQAAKVLLAELTTKNANVFYELGLAHAIGKPVVLVSETMNDVPFDLQPLRIILYSKSDPNWGEKLAADVTAALRETLATPVEAVPMIFRTRVQSQGPEQDATEARLELLERKLDLLQRHAPHAASTRREDRVKSIGIKVVIEARRVVDESTLKNWFFRWYRQGVKINDLSFAAEMAQMNQTLQRKMVDLFMETKREELLQT
jgi:hypothetical protein